MAGLPPSVIAINHDDYHAEHIGRTADGNQFLLTTPFDPASENHEGSEFVAIYLFDAEGSLLEAKIDSLGPRPKMDVEARKKLYEQRLAELGEVTFARIEVKPFSLERFGHKFGLILRKPEDEEDDWAVELLPGNYMAFFEPWDSGEYDT